jgi:quinol monooxygenase YgiN
MHIIVVGTVDMENNNVEEVLKGAKALIEEARTEPGCLAYNWSADPYIANRIHVFEEWVSEKSLADHLEAPSYVGMLGHLGQAGIKEAKTQKYRIDKFEPVYDETGIARADFFS